MNDDFKLLTASEADRLIAAGDGAAALLLLHVRTTGGFSLSAAAAALKRTETEIVLAADTLRRLGLLERPLPKKETPDYPAEDITRRAKTDRTFEALVGEAERALGRVLSGNDLRLLFGIYDHLGLPADVICLLLHHCIEAHQARSGAGRMPSMRMIEKEAWYWAEQEILNLDAAEAHIQREKEKQTVTEQVKSVLQISGRGLTASELDYIGSWIDLGYGPESLAVAYDRTVLSTGRLAWKYMDSIVRSWKEKGLYTPEEIARGDGRRNGRPAPVAAQPVQSDSDKLEAMRKMYEHMNRRSGGEG